MPFIDGIEQEITRQIAMLKPELKNKFNVRIVDNGGEKNVTEILDGTPPTMIFNLNVFMRIFHKNIRLIISRELIHVLKYLGEDPAKHDLESRSAFFTKEIDVDIKDEIKRRAK